MKKLLLNIALPLGFLIIAVFSIGPGCNDYSSILNADLDNDGHVFTTVNIGTQKWMQKNLDVSKYRNGDLIPEEPDQAAWAALTTGAWCYYENNGPNGPVYGRMYNWYAVTDPRGIAPAGWHVATDTEWTILTTFLGGDAVSGGPLKETGTTHWTTPNAVADNSSGFTALPGGYRKSNDWFRDLGLAGYWWTTTEQAPTMAWMRSMSNTDGVVYPSFGVKSDGLSVRCVKD